MKYLLVILIPALAFAQWSAPIQVTNSPGDEANVNVGPYGYESTYLIAWDQTASGNTDIYACTIDLETGELGDVMDVTDRPSLDQHPSIVTDLWGVSGLFFESDAGGLNAIYYSEYDGHSFSEPWLTVYSDVDLFDPKARTYGASVPCPTVIFHSDSAIGYQVYDLGINPQESFYFDVSGDLPVYSYEGYWGPYIYFDIAALRNAWETEIDGHREIEFGYCILVMPGNLITGLIPNSGYDYHHPAQAWTTLYIEREDNGVFDIISTEFDVFTGVWSDPQEVFTSFGNERNPDADQFDNLTFEVDWYGNTDIAYWHPGLAEAEIVSNDPGEDRNPFIIRYGDFVFIFWESNRDGNWNIYYAYRDAVGVEPEPEAGMPREFSVSVHPNPGNAQFTIDLKLPYADRTEVSVYDIAGRLIERINDSWLNSGMHTFNWQPEYQTSGIYIIGIASKQLQKTVKLVYLR